MKQLQEAQTIPFSNVFARIGKQNVIQYPGETISILDTGGRLFGMPQKANGFLWVLSIIENSESIWFPIHAEMDMHTLGRNKGLSWASGRGLLKVYWGWTDSASAGDQEEVC